jgi:hypothetical protein
MRLLRDPFTSPLIGQVNIAWHPLIASVGLIGHGIGQLRRIEIHDGNEVVERREEVDDKKWIYRYTLVAGIPASHYGGVVELKPKGAGCIADWRMQYLANDQPALQ